MKEPGTAMDNPESHNIHFWLFELFMLGLLYTTHELMGAVKGTFQSSPGLIKFTMKVTCWGQHWRCTMSALCATSQNQELSKALFISILSMVIQLANYS